MSKYTYFTPVEKLTRGDETRENIKAIALAVAMGLGMAVLLFFQLSK